MRFPDNTLIGDLNDNYSAKTSGSLTSQQQSSVNENETSYDLLPVAINKPPIITLSISEASTPKIQQANTADASGKYMYLFPDGSVKVNLGVDITLSMQAQQPNVLNVENGIPKLIPATSDLTYLWRKDGLIIASYSSDSLQSRLTVSGSNIIFKNIQPEHAGVYTCEVSNDIGTVTSEPITLEVLNLDFDSYFYKNLVRNPYGIEGTDEWNSLSTNLTTKNISKIPSQEYSRPNRVDLFGYTVDMMHPRPYQIDTGVIKNLNMTSNLLGTNASYFTRTRYKLLEDENNYLVRAYQDIDVTDIQDLIKGSIYGVEGVRAFFSCYIGNAISNFVPTVELTDIATRGDTKSYIMSKPRISVENFLNSGPGLGSKESIYITLEEFNNETRLPSVVMDDSGNIKSLSDRIIIWDPWSESMGNYWNRQFYTNDIYKVGQSPGGAVDAVLFTAANFYPNEQERYTYGQYVQFNKRILERLNPNTTKVRITLNFETNDSRLRDYYYTSRGGGSDEPYEFMSWDLPYKRHSWNVQPGTWQETILGRQINLTKNKDKLYRDFLPTINEPRGMITAVNLSLIPILTQKPAETTDYTKKTLIVNNTIPKSTTTSGLTFSRPYDPNNLLGREIRAQFKMLSDDALRVNNNYQFEVRDQIELSFMGYNPSALGDKDFRLDVDSNNIFPFKRNSSIFVETTPTMLTSEAVLGQKLDFNNYLGYLHGNGKAPFNTPNVGNTTYNVPSFSGSIERVYDTHDMTIDKTSMEKRYQDSNKIRYPSSDNAATWNAKARYIVYLFASGSSLTPININRQFLQQINLKLQTYYLTIDFEDVNNKKVTLSRDLELYPGQGVGSIEIPHYVNGEGILICKFPSTLLFESGNQGGLGYSTYTGSFEYQGAPIDSVKVLYSNLGVGSTVDLKKNIHYRSNLKTIIEPVSKSIYYQDTPITQLNATEKLERPSYITQFTSEQLKAFTGSLYDFAFDQNKTVDENIYGDINKYYVNKSKLEIDQNKAFSSYDAFGSELTEMALAAQKAGFGRLTQTSDFIDEYGNNLGPYKTKTIQVPVTSGQSLLGSVGQPSYVNQTVSYVVVPKQANKPTHLGNIRNPLHQTSLVAVKSNQYETTTDRIGTPMYGNDINGVFYDVVYLPIQDSYNKSYTPTIVLASSDTTNANSGVTVNQANYESMNP